MKICGITDPAVGAAAADAGADYLGLVFAERIRRVTPAEAGVVVAAVAGRVRAVGVFVDADAGEVLDARDVAGFEVAQLHGDETPRLCTELRGEGLDVWKALRPRSEADLGLLLERYAAEVDAVLIEGFSPEAAGGTGTAFPYEWLRSCGRGPTPLVLAGGLTPENVAGAIESVGPDIVDVSSGVESAPGVKSVERIRAFLGAVRANASVPRTNEGAT